MSFDSSIEKKFNQYIFEGSPDIEETNNETDSDEEDEEDIDIASMISGLQNATSFKEARQKSLPMKRSFPKDTIMPMSTSFTQINHRSSHDADLESEMSMENISVSHSDRKPNYKDVRNVSSIMECSEDEDNKSNKSNVEMRSADNDNGVTESYISSRLLTDSKRYVHQYIIDGVDSNIIDVESESKGDSDNKVQVDDADVLDQGSGTIEDPSNL